MTTARYPSLILQSSTRSAYPLPFWPILSCPPRIMLILPRSPSLSLFVKFFRGSFVSEQAALRSHCLMRYQYRFFAVQAQLLPRIPREKLPALTKEHEGARPNAASPGYAGGQGGGLVLRDGACA